MPSHLATIAKPEDFQLDKFFDALLDGKTCKAARAAASMSLKQLWFLCTNHPEFSKDFSSARDLGYDELADSILEIAELEPDVRRADVRIRGIQWLLSRRKANVYGDRLDVTVTKTVDIGAALGEAMRRALPQRVETTDVFEIPATGQQPVPLNSAGEITTAEPTTLDELLE